MRFIRIIIALTSIYLFIGVISFLVIIFVWLSRFSPDFPTNSVAQITATASIDNKSDIIMDVLKSASVVNTMLTRDSHLQSQKKNTYTVQSETLFVTYEKISLKPMFVPLGFFSLYRLESITDAEGKIVFAKSNDLLDTLFDTNWQLFGESSHKTISLLARPQATSYTVSISTEGVNYHEN